ncbi:chalcone isomerase family protein [Uliginosibacterium sp. H1]|uniref:chalcone isomerase family protein n=1 Tax=Uliginosibacterium sp. H1 TaxID=3114757 RepID=UPI002E1845C9|nr:chalcone isomerase family protein [Uliginosibacterium sp. H1]
MRTVAARNAARTGISKLLRASSVLLVAIAILLVQNSQATEVGGVKLDDKVSVAGQELVLNGAGLRTRLMFKVYVIGLYLPVKTDSASTALAGNPPRRVQIVTLRELSGEQLADSLVESLQKNLSKPELEALGSRIESFRKTMLAVGKAPEKTVIRLDYLPERGTRLTVAETQRGEDIPGAEFYQALLRIWLGAQPAQEDLRAALLGKPQ